MPCGSCVFNAAPIVLVSCSHSTVGDRHLIDIQVDSTRYDCDLAFLLHLLPSIHSLNILLCHFVFALSFLFQIYLAPLYKKLIRVDILKGHYIDIRTVGCCGCIDPDLVTSEFVL